MSQSSLCVTPLFALLFVLCRSGTSSDVRLPPTITMEPVKGSYYRNGDSFTLECKAHGVPEVVYEWTKNDRDLNLNGNNVRRVTDGTIKVSPSTSLDVGFYQCIARNQYGVALSIVSYMQMAVLENKGSTQVLTQIVNEGDPFCVEAQPTRSIPKAKPNWHKTTDPAGLSSVSISLNSRVQLADNGALCFAYATTEDDLGGKIYKLTEFNEHLDVTTGGSYTNVTVKRVAGVPKQFRPTLGFSSPHQTVAVEGQNVTLSCFFFGNPEPSLAWKWPKIFDLLPGRYQLGTYNTRLTIQNVQPGDEGDYICSGGNANGQNNHTMQIRVDAAPKFLSTEDQPHDTNVTEGATVTFRCHTYAKPNATVVWLRDGQKLDTSNLPPKYLISSDKKSLTIENLCRDCPDRSDNSRSDLTVIQCNASNMHGYAFGAGFVNVLSRTTLEFTGERNISVDLDKEMSFTWDCKATSDPSTPPLVRWYKETTNGDKEIHEVPPFLLLKDGTLKIHVVPNKTHGWTMFNGTYRCDVSNGYSKQSVSVGLTINHYNEPVRAWIEWWMILAIFLLIILIILISICCFRLLRNKGDEYNVDEKERRSGHDPEQELLDNGFQDYQRPECIRRKDSRVSFGSLGKMPSDDEGSLVEFADDPGKFTEDGSFVGAYASNTVDRSRGRKQ